MIKSEQVKAIIDGLSDVAIDVEYKHGQYQRVSDIPLVNSARCIIDPYDQEPSGDSLINEHPFDLTVDAISEEDLEDAVNALWKLDSLGFYNNKYSLGGRYASTLKLTSSTDHSSILNINSFYNGPDWLAADIDSIINYIQVRKKTLYLGPPVDVEDVGLLRFAPETNQKIISATNLKLIVDSGGSSTKMELYGLDEDVVTDLIDRDYIGTTALDSVTRTYVTNETVTFDVSAIVAEITSRAGWDKTYVGFAIQLDVISNDTINFFTSDTQDKEPTLDVILEHFPEGFPLRVKVQKGIKKKVANGHYQQTIKWRGYYL